MVEVVLVPMTPEAYVEFRRGVIRGYAASGVQARRWTAEEAPAAAEKEIDGLLPKGVATPDHFLFTVHETKGGPKVGVLWVTKRKNEAFVYELEIDEAHRGRGLGRATMLEAEKVARGFGTPRIGLHVFGANATARALYKSLGYAETSVLMSKDLP